MFVNILKKDLKRKKVMNGVLFVFITLCTVFLASSVSNLFMTTNALDYFEERAQLNDYFVLAGDDELTSWLEEHENVDRFEVNQLINTANEGINRVLVEVDGEQRLLTSTGEGFGGDAFFTRLPQDLNLPLDIDNNPIRPINSGEIVLNFTEARHNGLDVGDLVHIEIGDDIYSFEIVQLVKDIMFFPRLFISDEDFTQLAETLDVNFYAYAIETNDLSAFTSSLNRATFTLATRANADMFMNIFMVDLMMMVILVIVGACLIAISFVVLRFAIVFTLQEDYKEIGIMKAIGLKNKDIKKVYLVKYLFLAIAGAGLGFMLSTPFSNLLTGEMAERIAFPEAGSMVWIQLASTVAVVVLIMTFCLMSTRKLNKFTAMQAIRSGETGERFKRKNVMHLHRMKKMPSVVYLALNDILSNKKSYVTLLIVFTLGFVLAVMPLNATYTLAPETFAELMGLPESDFYLDELTFEMNPFDGTVADLRDELAAIEAANNNQGLELELFSKITVGGIVYTDSIYEGIVVNGISQIVSLNDMNDEPLEMIRGFAPTLANEVALTEMLLDRLNLNIGDEVSLAIGGVSQTFIITGSYETLMYLGIGVRLSEAVVLHDEASFAVYSVQGNFTNRVDVEEQLAQLEANATGYTVMTVDDFVEANMMDVSIVDTVGQLLLIVVVLVNILIIVLMSVSFMLRDLKQIALLKSLGFSNLTIKLWQGLRILFIMVLALVIGGLLVPGANILMSMPFGILGTPSLTLNIDVVSVYVIYPIIFMVATALTLTVTTLAIKKVGLRDLGQAD